MILLIVVSSILCGYAWDAPFESYTSTSGGGIHSIDRWSKWRWYLSRQTKSNSESRQSLDKYGLLRRVIMNTKCACAIRTGASWKYPASRICNGYIFANNGGRPMQFDSRLIVSGKPGRFRMRKMRFPIYITSFFSHPSQFIINIPFFPYIKY